jgi:aldehyde:ferredoxin oxidoreductase
MSRRFGGWTEKVLHVDLSEEKFSPEKMDPSLLRTFLGGRGLNSLVLFQNLKKSVDPFGPENLLAFGSGPLVGTLIPANGRYNVSSRSPLTNLLGDANSAGFWAPVLKKVGYDGIVVRGISDSPVYLFITQEKTEIRDASRLWGKTVSETDKHLRQEHGQDAHVIAIGPGGENRVRFASIMTDIDRAAGRTGNGAVMGSKKLKAIVVCGRGRVSPADPQKTLSVAREIKRVISSAPSFSARSQLGTPMVIQIYNQMGVLPAKNHQTGIFAGAEKISGERLKEQYVNKAKACYMCPIHCSRYSEIREGRFSGTKMEGPEFETMCFMGSNLLNSDLGSILYLNRRLNDLGMDSISTGATIAYAMECYEKGLISTQETDGLQLTWGNIEAIISLVDRIAYRKGFGSVLAEGVRRASETIEGSEKYALHVKGMEVPGQEVRGLKAWGLGWATSSRGGDHCRAFPVMETIWSPKQTLAFFGSEKAADRFSYEGKPAMVKWAEDLGAVIDSLGLCKIAYVSMGVPVELIAAAFQAVTGVKMDEEQILIAGERINNLERLLNLNLGLTPAEDTLPSRFVEEPLPEGPSQGERINIEQMVEEYYRLRRWDPVTGYPSMEKLNELSLKHLDNPRRGLPWVTQT